MIVYQNNFENGFGGNVTVEGDTVIKSTGAGNSAAYFDGEGDGLRLINSSLNLGRSDFDISFRMKAVGNQDYYSVILSSGTGSYFDGTYSPIIEVGNGSAAGVGTGGMSMLYFNGYGSWNYIWDNNKVDNVNVNDGSWHTFSMKRSGGKGSFSIDGSTTSDILSIPNDKALIDLRNLRIGRWAGNDLTDNNFTGYIDDLKIEILDSQAITNPIPDNKQDTVSIPGLVNTGAGLSNGDLDRNYQFIKIQGTATGTSGYSITQANNTWPIGDGWILDNKTSHWLTPSSNPSQSYDNSSDGLYNWSLEFDLSGYNPKTASFSARVAADDSVQIKLNGNPIKTVSSATALSKFTNFSANSGFLDAKNELEFIVTNNKGGVYPNPVGLRVEFISSSIQKNSNSEPTGVVELSGNFTQNQTLYADTSQITDADGLGAFSYQWQRSADGKTWKNIGGASQNRYDLSAADVGQSVRVALRYTDGNGTAETVYSAASMTIAGSNHLPTGWISVTGLIQQEQMLAVDTQNLSDADGLGSFRYQWLADGTALDKATGNTLVLTEAQVGKRISVAVSYTDGQGTAEQVSSAASAVVANVNDIPKGTVTINGKTLSGNVLTLNQNLVDADGLGFFSYEWLAGSKVVGTGDRYTLTAAEVGKTLSVTLHYTDGHGTAEQVSSAETGIVTATATLIKGTARHDKWIGKAGDERFDGLAGNDTLSGLAGNDSLIGNTGNDSLDGGVGNDNLRGDAGNDILLGGSGDDSLDGGFDNDLLDGGNGNDTLQGGTGIDTLKGGEGNDLYFVDNFRDQIIDVAGALGGNDSVQSSRNYTLPVNVENLLLTGLQNLTGTGNDAANRITGTSGDNVLDGRNGNDALVGGNGDDTLIGGGGVDTLTGGDGSDTYQVSSMEDAIIENAKDGDQDVVESKVDYELGDNIEVLVLLDAALTGYGNGLDNVLVGTANANVLNGGDGDDSLQGEAGDDSLDGGSGDDTLDGGEGQDVVMYSGELSDYKITYDQDSQSWRVEDVNLADGQDDGTDTLTGIEMLALADQDYPLLVGVVNGEW